MHPYSRYFVPRPTPLFLSLALTIYLMCICIYIYIGLLYGLSIYYIGTWVPKDWLARLLRLGFCATQICSYDLATRNCRYTRFLTTGSTLFALLPFLGGSLSLFNQNSRNMGTLIIKGLLRNLVYHLFC